MASSDNYILMLGSDQDDQHLTLSILEELGIRVPVRFVPNGAKLIAAIEAQEPMLVLVDFNLQPENGLDILDSIRERAGWRHLPVVVLGESPDPGFVKLCYSKGANSYVLKPNSLEGTRRVINGFFAYWLQVAETPAHRAEFNTVPR
jgi:CheY-like chemotaxis protein